MSDHFTLLDEPRRPWLEPERLKEKFLALSAAVHPDRVHNLSPAERENAQQHCTELNAAYNCLREPRLRLRHLLELELGRKPSDLTQVPDDLMELFFVVGKALREADAFLAEKEQASSPLIKVQLFERGMGWTETLGQLLQQLGTRRMTLMAELKALDAGWSSPAPPATLARLEHCYRLFSYFDRWLAQLHERTARLSF